MEPAPDCFLFPALDGCSGLYMAVAIALFLSLARVILSSPIMWDKRTGRGLRSISSSSAAPQGHPAPRQGRLPETASEEEGAREPRSERPRDRAGWAASVRKLLCDNVACAVCGRTALEAAETLRTRARGLWSLAFPRRPRPAATSAGRPSATSVPRRRPAFPQSSSDAAPSGGQPGLSRDGPPPLGNEEPQARGRDAAAPSCPHSQTPCKGEGCCGSSVGYPGLPRRLRASSSTPEPVYTSWTPHGSPSDPSDSSSESMEEGWAGRSALRKPRGRLPRRRASPATAAGPLRASPATSEPLTAGVSAAAAPWVAEAVQEALERHVAVKTAQHHLGLPLTLLRSLRAFSPSVPGSAPPGPPRRDTTVAVRTRPRALPFVSAACRGRLEQHVRSVAHWKRWGLPRKVREALRHLQPSARLLAGHDGQRTGGPHRRTASGGVDTARTQGPPLWGLPTPDTRPLPSAHLLPAAAPSRTEPAAECCRAEVPFLALRELQRLESHLLWKRARHRWGLPRLIQRSWQQFRLPAPTTAPPGGSTRHFPGQAEEPPGSSSSPSSDDLETQEQLEGYIQRETAQRHWGYPRAVAEGQGTLTPYSPPVARRFRDSEEEDGEPPAGEELSSGQQSPALPRPVARKTLDIRLELEEPVCRGAQSRTRDPPATAPLTLRVQQPRAQELPFDIRISIRRRGPGYKPRPGAPQAPPPPLPRRAAAPAFLAAETPFLEQSAREGLEWHVRRKALQHAWGLPGLVRRSLRSFLPPAPRLQASGHTEVRVLLPPGLPFLPGAAVRALEKSVRKRGALQRWGLPKRVLESLRLLSPEYGLGTPRGPPAPSLGPRTRESRPGRPGGPPGVAGLPGLSPHSPLPSRGPSTPWALPSRKSTYSVIRTEDSERLSLAVLRRRLESLWGPGAGHSDARSGLAPTPAAARLTRPSRGTYTFQEVQLSFVPAQDQEALEQHLVRKRLHHSWGLPLLVRRSLQGFVGQVPAVPARPRTEVHVHILQPEAGFLPRDVCRHLELHVQKVKLQRRWGLPRRVLRSLRPLHPEAAGLPAPEHGAWGLRGTAATPTLARPETPSETWRSESLEQLQLCLAKKCLEVQLGISWQSPPPPPRTPLPKPIPPGHRPLQPRRHLLPFGLAEGLERVEMALRRRRLESLWGLGARYVAALGGLPPPLPLRPLRARRAAVACSDAETPFLPPLEREALELHVRSKQLQHLWGLPGLVRRSLAGFLQESPAQRPLRQAAATQVRPGPQDLWFLAPGVRGHLEQHIRSAALRRQWRLPRKVLQATRGRAPSPLSPAPVESGSRTGPGLGEGSGAEAPAPGQTRVLVALGSTALARMRRHLAQKSLEVLLGALPAEARLSRHGPQLPLPRPASPGQQAPRPRSTFLPFARPEEVGQVEVVVLRRHLEALWGLGRSYVEAASAVWPRPSSGRPRASRVGVEGLGEGEDALFLPAQAREGLELHLRKKRLQHQWGFPGLVQRSLDAFLPRVPLQPPSRSQADTAIRVTLWEGLPVPQSTCRHLEFHLQRLRLQRRWRLPRRVLESVQALGPPPGADPSAPGSAGRGRGPCCCRLDKGGLGDRSAVGVTSWRAAASMVAAPERARGLLVLEPRAISRLQLHLAKKYLEMQLEALPPAAGLSWGRGGVSAEWKLLPKVILPGGRLQQPRSACRALHAGGAHRIDMALRCSHLASLWGSGTHLDGEALRGAVLGKPPRARRCRVEFVEADAPFLPEQDREALELHVKRKTLQHLWGFPRLVRGSLKAFMQGGSLPPRVPEPKTPRVCILRQEPPFLPQDVLSRLEFHVQKMTLQRQWGLPRRVLQSLWQLHLGLGAEGAGPRRWRPCCDLVCRPPGSAPARWPTGGPFTKQDPGETSGGLSPRPGGSPLLPGLESKMRRHLAKKCVEVRLEAVPSVARVSWSRAALREGRPLPKLIPPGNRVLQRRSSPPSSVPTEGVGRLELAVRRNHFASLWGLGVRHKRALAGMPPRPTAPLGRGRGGADSECLERETPFLREQAREALELHVKRKRMQHAWGFPRLVQGSLRAFMHKAPSLPAHQKSELHVHPQAPEPSCIPAATYARLESHVRRLKQQQRWGLPRKIRGAMKALLPSAPLARTPRSQREGLPERSGGEGREPAAQRRRGATDAFSADQKTHVQGHLHKKQLEVRLAAQPRQVRQSRQAAGGSGRGRLPVVIPAGRRQPPARAGRLFCLPPETVKELEWNVKRKYLAFLWGRPLRHVAKTVVHGPAPTRPGSSAFREVECAFLRKEEKEELERHVLKKTLQHQWRLPSAVRRSLRAFAPPPHAPTSPSPARPGQAVRVQVAEGLTFLPSQTRRELDKSVKRMNARQQWRLAKKAHESLRAFLPAGGGPPFQAGAEGTQETGAGGLPRGASSETPTTPATDAPSMPRISEPKRLVGRRTSREKSPSARGVTSATARPLPKGAPLYRVAKPRSTFLPFLEQEAADKADMNIRHKYLSYLWHQPVLYIKPLSRARRSSPAQPPGHAARAEVGTAQAVPDSRVAKGHSEEGACMEERTTRRASGEEATQAGEDASIGAKTTQGAEKQEDAEGGLQDTEEAGISDEGLRATEEISRSPRTPQRAEGQSVGTESAQAPEEEALHNGPRPPKVGSISELQPMGSEASASRWANKHIADERPPFMEEGTMADERPPSTEEGSMADKWPPSMEEVNVADERPPFMEEGSIADERPPSTEEGSMADEGPPAMEEGSMVDERPPSTEEVSVAVERPPFMEEVSVADERPPSTEEGRAMDDRPPFMEEGSTVDEWPAECPLPSEGGSTTAQGLGQDARRPLEPCLRSQATAHDWDLSMRAQALMKSFARSAQSWSHKEARAVAKAHQDSCPGPQRRPHLYRSELHLVVQQDGSVSSRTATAKPPLLAEAPTSVVIPGRGGSEEGAPRGSVERLPHPEGGTTAPLVPRGPPWPPVGPEHPSGTAQEPRRPPPSPQAAQPGQDEHRASSSYAQVRDFWRLHRAAKSQAPTLSPYAERLRCCPRAVSWHLECSLRDVGQSRFRPGGARGAPPSPETWRGGRPACECTAAAAPQAQSATHVGQRGLQVEVGESSAMPSSSVPLEDHEGPSAGLPSGATAQGIAFPGPRIPPERRSAGGALHLLQTLRVSQGALGSLSLPPRVLASHTVSEALVTTLLRQAGSAHRERLSRQASQRGGPVGKLQPASPGLPWPDQDQGNSSSSSVRRRQALTVGRPGGLGEGAEGCPSEARPGPEAPEWFSGSGEAPEGGPQSYREDRKVSGGPDQPRSPASALGEDGELPAPPSEWLGSEADRRESEGTSALKTASQTPSEASSGPGSQSVEEQSQFSTEWEWEEVGDWDTEQGTACSSGGLAQGEEGSGEEGAWQALEEEGPRPQRGAGLGAQGRRESSPVSSRKDTDQALIIIGSILERKLHLQEGFDTWLLSKGWRRERDGQSPPVGEGEDSRTRSRAGAKPGAGPARPGKPRPLAQADGEPHGPGRPHLPEAPRRGGAGGVRLPHRPGRSSQGSQRDGGRAGDAAYRAGQGGKAWGRRAGAKEGGLQDPSPLEGPAGQDDGSSGPGVRSSSSSTTRPRKTLAHEERLGRGEETSSSEEQGPASPRGSREREKRPVLRVRFVARCAAQATCVHRQGEFTPLSPSPSGGCPKGGILKRRHPQDSRPAAGPGRVGQEAPPRPARRDPQPDSQHGPPPGDLFHSLKEQVCLRRRMLWSSASSEEDPA
ncbi:hypothetical protein lerEdw1_015988 [Lerista edwardsae]|nr:hypothetical protein lerEdw1_015988 [Lerista edwardsae]